jgi:hypothetical protein
MRIENRTEEPSSRCYFSPKARVSGNYEMFDTLRYAVSNG